MTLAPFLFMHIAYQIGVIETVGGNLVAPQS